MSEYALLRYVTLGQREQAKRPMENKFEPDRAKQATLDEMVSSQSCKRVAAPCEKRYSSKDRTLKALQDIYGFWAPNRQSE